MNLIARRIRELRRRLPEHRLAAAYLTSPISRRYFTGFTGTAGAVLVTKDTVTLFTDFRYTERAAEETSDEIIVVQAKSPTQEIKKICSRERIGRLGIEDRVLTVASYNSLLKKFKGIKLVGLGTLLEEIRAVKDKEELILLRRAVAATDTVFLNTRQWIKARKRAKQPPTEEAVAWKVRDLIHTKKFGELSFDTIIASGPNSARPHHEPARRALRFGEAVIIDLGVAIGGYHADMTRTIFIDEPSAKLKEMYRTTLRAQQAATSYFKHGGRRAAQADAAARKIIEKKFPDSFGHSLGHGVGLEIHEKPTLSATSSDRLKPGMVFSIEPGIYLSGEAGIRIEDLVLLKKGGCEVLSKSPKSLAQSIL